MVGGGNIFRAKLGIWSGPGALFLRCLIMSVTSLGDMAISFCFRRVINIALGVPCFRCPRCLRCPTSLGRPRVGRGRGTSPAPARNRYLRRVRDTPCIFEATRDGQDESRRATCVCVHARVSTRARARVRVASVSTPRVRCASSDAKYTAAEYDRRRRPIPGASPSRRLSRSPGVSVFGRSFRGFRLELGGLSFVRSFGRLIGRRRRLLGPKMFAGRN